MSSHHIVRDNQEPALLILDVASASLDTLGDLLEWSPLVLVHSSCAEKVLSWGIKIDVVLGPVSGELTQRLAHQQPIVFLADVSASAVPVALRYLAAKQFKAVNIISTEEPWADVEPYTTQLSVCLITATLRWSFIGPGEIEKRVPERSAYRIRQHHTETVVEATNGIIREHRSAPFWLGESLA